MDNKKSEQNVMPSVIIKKRFEFLRDKRYVLNVFLKAGLFIFCIYLVFTLIFGITVMKNSDMMPRLSAGDLILYYRLQDSYICPNIVVFNLDGQKRVARVIAAPGETIEITDGKMIKLNGNSIIEDDIFYKTFRYDDKVQYPVTLAEDEYFVMCDSREGAKDSRYFGPIKESQIKGYVVTVLRRNNL